MHIRPSSELRNNYIGISELARTTGEPIFITNKGEGDGVFISVDAWEAREKMFRHRDMVYAAELSRLSGEPTVTQEALDKRMEELFHTHEEE
jgi:prevent-host-death family protein